MTESLNATDSDVPRVAPDHVHEAAPALGWYSDHVLFHQIWNRPGLSRRDRSIVTVAALITGYQMAQLTGHLNRALDHGVTHIEIVEIVTHLAFYAGWPCAMSAIKVVREVLEARGIDPAKSGQSTAHYMPPHDQQVTEEVAFPAMGAFSMALAECTDRVIQDDLWQRRELSPRDRSLVTLSSVIAEGTHDSLLTQARFGLTNGLLIEEMSEAVIHLSFYVGQPKARNAARILDPIAPKKGSS